MKKVQSKGQSLSEYGLVAVLVGVASISALVLLGGSLQNAMQNLWPQPVLTTAPVISAVSNGTNSKSPDSGAASGTHSVAITLESGKVITLPAYPNNLAQMVETLGANGTTAIMSDNLKLLAEEMLAAGEIDEAQYNSLVLLANKGHEIGRIERDLEGIISESTTYAGLMSGLKAHPELFNAKNTSILIGFDNPLGGVVTGSLDSMDNLNAKGFTQEFLLAYQEVARNGSLEDPVIKLVVDQLSADISSLSDSMEHETNKVLHQLGGSYDPNQVLTRIVSDMTHQDAVGICATGNGQDTGVQCSG